MPGKIKISQINHVTTMVKDTARAMKFYNDLLGIKQIESQVPNPAITWLQLDNLEETKKSLKENGYEIKREGVRYDGQAYLFIEAPDGNSVEFCTAAGYAPAPPRP